MPRTNLCTSAKEQKQEKRMRYLRGLIQCGFEMKELDAEKVAKKTGVTSRTVRDRLQNISSVNIANLYELCDLAGIKITFEVMDIPE